MTHEHRSTQGSSHPTAELAEFAADLLAPDVARLVRAHLDGCPACSTDLDDWRAIADVVRVRALESVPSGPLAQRITDAIRVKSQASTTRRPGLGWLVAIVGAQVPLVRREVWPASALVIAIGTAVSLLLSRGSTPGLAVALFAPIAAALSITLIYGQENDPSLELALATSTSARVVLVARLLVVLAWDLGLALAASLLLGIIHGPQVIAPLVGLWLGPMLLLSCLSLVLSLVIGITPALAIACLVWGLRAYELSSQASVRSLAGLGQLLDALWQTTPLTMGIAGVALGLALVVVSRAEPRWTRAI